MIDAAGIDLGMTWSAVAYFTHPQRTATIAAGQQAGLDVLKLLNEPTAALALFTDVNRLTDSVGTIARELTGARVAASANEHVGGLDKAR